MATIETRTLIRAPLERVFDLARSVDLHVASTTRTRERAVGGVVSGLLTGGDEVTWSARHFGIRQRLTSRITRFEPPTYFRDEMVSGAFSRLCHDHYFQASGSGTEMRDLLDFRAPLGWLGRAADALVLRSYLRRFIEERNQIIREVAESGRWSDFLPRSQDG